LKGLLEGDNSSGADWDRGSQLFETLLNDGQSNDSLDCMKLLKALTNGVRY
jgi:hypothetical protein